MSAGEIIHLWYEDMSKASYHPGKIDKGGIRICLDGFGRPKILSQILLGLTSPIYNHSVYKGGLLINCVELRASEINL